MSFRSIRTVLFHVSLCSLAALACSAKDDTGTVGEACYPNGTCNAGLVCDRGMCLPTNGSTGDGDESSTDASGDGDGDGTISEALTEALEGCFDCGATGCKDEADACDAEGGCMEALECSLACVGDATCGSKCDVSGLTSSGVTAMSNYTVCTATACSDECGKAISDALTAGGDGDSATGDGDATTATGDGDSTTATGDGDSTTATGDGDTGNTGEACSVEGEVRSSCVEGSPEVCFDGSWYEESCNGCSLVSPSTSCERVTHAALIMQTEEDHVSVIPSSESFEQSATSVLASWTFASAGYQQYGLVSFRFASEVNPNTVAVDGNGGIATVTIENADGSSGCEYVLSGTTLVLNQTLDYYGEVAWNGCWGSSSDARTVINVRSDRVLSGTAALEVYSITL